MTDNRTTELREKLTERGVEHEARDGGTLHVTSWLARGVQWNYREIGDTHSLTMGNPWVGCTPEQAISATLGNKPDITELTQSYDAGFRNGVMAVYQQLEGIESYEELQDLIAEYWGEGEGYDER